MLQRAILYTCRVLWWSNFFVSLPGPYGDFLFDEPYDDFLLFFQREYILRKYSHGKGDLFFYVEPRVSLDNGIMLYT